MVKDMFQRLIAAAITSLGALCVGYTLSVQPVQADGVPSPSSQQVQDYGISGEKLHAFLSAYGDFKNLTSLSSNQKVLDHYDVIIVLNKNGEYTVWFQPRRAQGESPLPGGATSLGLNVIFYVSSKSYKVDEHMFLR